MGRSSEGASSAYVPIGRVVGWGLVRVAIQISISRRLPSLPIRLVTVDEPKVAIWVVYIMIRLVPKEGLWLG